MNKVYISVIVFLVLIGSYFYSKPSEAPVASPSPTPHTDFREIIKVNPKDNQVVLSINAGFGERSAEGILSALKKHNYKTTFFLVGEWVEDHPELTRRIRDDGHEIFNHSYAHPDYTHISADEIKTDLQKMDDVLFQIAGIRTRPYFRAPFGYRNEMVKQAAAEIGFQHIYWSVDSIDWREGETGASIQKRVLDHLHPGAIVLLHIGDLPTGEIMDELITEIKARGYKLASLTEALAQE
jgi:peptidoglycan/xylan/chitin deacetylase (PgdA/CDA1 family)